jgi:FMN phosphatase YigB (HAD superfamily)
VNLRPGEIKHIFLDDGDVINDNRLRAPQWQRLVGEFFVPRLGGTGEAWARANVATVGVADEAFWKRLRANKGTYTECHVQYELDWLRLMAQFVGVESPADDEECFALSHEASAYITRRVRAAFPGAIDAIRELGGRYVLRTASNEHSHDLLGYLEGMEVAYLFRGFYGGDLLSATKHEASYYPRLFADAGVDPATSLVVDDKAEFLQAAAAAGAQVMRVSESRVAEGGIATIRSLGELPALLRDAARG